MNGFERLVFREPIDQGWSADRKFRAVDGNGRAYFLRISPEKQYESRKLQFAHMEKVRALGVRVCEPVEFGFCPEGCYTLLGWVDGRDAEEVLPELTGAEPWAVHYGRKLDAKVALYENSPLKYEKGELFLELLRRERHLIENRPTVWHHGDFHCGNLMFDREMRLTVIDFDREDVGDPWYEFNRIIWDVRVGAEFARGLLDGYFGGVVPEEFWRILRLYLCQNMLSSLPWAAGFGDSEIQIARDNARRVLSWYDDLREIVPDWY